MNFLKQLNLCTTISICSSGNEQIMESPCKLIGNIHTHPQYPQSQDPGPTA